MGKKSNKTTTKNKLPDYINRGSERAVGMGMDISNREYTPYEGERVAGLSQNEGLASQQARDDQGLAQGYVRQGADALGRVGAFTDADMGAYMNPYIENVLDVGQRKMNEGFGSKEAELQRTSGMRSAFGGGRQTQMETELSANQLESTGDFWAEGMGGAFDRATGLWGQDQDRAIAQAGAYGGLSRDSSSATSSDIRNLAGTGLVERSIDQSQKDFDYGQFIEERDWDITNMAPLLDALSRAPHETTSSTETETSSSPLASVVGAAATVAGAVASGGITVGLDLLKAGTSLLSGPPAPSGDPAGSNS